MVADVEGLASEVSHYAALGVEPSATAEQLKAAYRKRALLLHPDHNGADDGRAASAFVRVAAAWEVLGDEAARRRYDETEAQALWRKSCIAAGNRAIEHAATQAALAQATVAPAEAARADDRDRADAVLIVQLRHEGAFGWRVEQLLSPPDVPRADARARPACVPADEWRAWLRLFGCALPPPPPMGPAGGPGVAATFRCFALPSAEALGFTAHEAAILGACATPPRSVYGVCAHAAARDGCARERDPQSVCLLALLHGRHFSAAHAATMAVWLGAMASVAPALPVPSHASCALAPSAATRRPQPAAAAQHAGAHAREPRPDGPSAWDAGALLELHAGMTLALRATRAELGGADAAGGDGGGASAPECAELLGWPHGPSCAQLVGALGALETVRVLKLLLAGGSLLVSSAAESGGCDGAVLAVGALLATPTRLQRQAQRQQQQAPEGGPGAPCAYPPAESWCAFLPSVGPCQLPLLCALLAPAHAAASAPPALARAPSAADGAEGGAAARVRQWVCASVDGRLSAPLGSMAAGVLSVARLPRADDSTELRWQCSLSLLAPAAPGGREAPPAQVEAAAAAALLSSADVAFASELDEALRLAPAAESGQWLGSSDWVAAECGAYVQRLCASAVAAMSARTLSAAPAVLAGGCVSELLCAYGGGFLGCWLRTPACARWAKQEGLGAASRWLSAALARATDSADALAAAAGPSGGSGLAAALADALGFGASAPLHFSAPSWLSRGGAAGGKAAQQPVEAAPRAAPAPETVRPVSKQPSPPASPSRAAPSGEPGAADAPPRRSPSLARLPQLSLRRQAGLLPVPGANPAHGTAAAAGAAAQQPQPTADGGGGGGGGGVGNSNLDSLRLLLFPTRAPVSPKADSTAGADADAFSDPPLETLSGAPPPPLAAKPWPSGPLGSEAADSPLWPLAQPAGREPLLRWWVGSTAAADGGRSAEGARAEVHGQAVEVLLGRQARTEPSAALDAHASRPSSPHAASAPPGSAIPRAPLQPNQPSQPPSLEAIAQLLADERDAGEGPDAEYGASVVYEVYLGGHRDGQRHGIGLAMSGTDSYAGHWAHGLRDGEGVWRAVGFAAAARRADRPPRATQGVARARADEPAEAALEVALEPGVPAGARTDEAATAPAGASADESGGDLLCSAASFHSPRVTAKFGSEPRWAPSQRASILTDAHGERAGEPQRYEGAWLLGERDGFGSQVYAGGAQYDGEWRKSARAGVGTLRWPDGSLYAGEWASDLPCGEGLRVVGSAPAPAAPVAPAPVAGVYASVAAAAVSLAPPVPATADAHALASGADEAVACAREASDAEAPEAEAANACAAVASVAEGTASLAPALDESRDGHDATAVLAAGGSASATLPPLAEAIGAAPEPALSLDTLQPSGVPSTSSLHVSDANNSRVAAVAAIVMESAADDE